MLNYNNTTYRNFSMVIVIYNASKLLLSFAFAFIGSYIATSLTEIYRLSSSSEFETKLLSRESLLLLTALTLGGIGVWGMHFIGMTSVTLQTSDGLILSVQYNWVYTFLSFIAVVFFCYLGLLISSFDNIFTKHKNEVVESFILKSKSLSMREIKQIGNLYIVVFISTESLLNLIGGGILTGAGCVVMHYLGMMALEFDGYIKWNIGIIAASIVIAILASTAAFWILFRLLSLYPSKEFLRFICAILMAIGVSGMHYTGMQAATFVAGSDTNYHNPDNLVVSEADAGTFAIVASSIAASILTILIFMDLRKWHYGASKQLTEMNKLFEKMKHETSPLFHTYVHQYNLIKSKVKPSRSCCQSIQFMNGLCPPKHNLLMDDDTAHHADELQNQLSSLTITRCTDDSEVSEHPTTTFTSHWNSILSISTTASAPDKTEFHSIHRIKALFHAKDHENTHSKIIPCNEV